MKRRSLKKICLVLTFLGILGNLSALDLSLRGRGLGFFPLGDGAADYSFGGGGEFLFDVDLSRLFPSSLGLGFTLDAEAGINSSPLSSGEGEDLRLYSLGAGAGIHFFPLSRLMVRGEGAGGYYQGYFQDATSGSWWLRAGGEAGFRITPRLISSLSAGYRYYNDKYGGTMNSGIYLGITLQINLGTGSGGGADATLIQDEPIFPLFLSLYQQNAGGTLRITNHESAELRNVRVSFRAQGYSSSEFLCGTLAQIPRGRTMELPLLADFSPELLNMTENGRILGEVVVRYELLGAERSALTGISVRVNNRNSFRWVDPGALAAFVSPTSPEILELSRYLSGIARVHQQTALNPKMQFGIYFFEGLREAGVRLSLNPATPYAGYHTGTDSPIQKDSIDSIQFPLQTLAFRGGDVDDLGLLYAALLESAGIRAALIPMNNDFITALSLGISSAQAASLFNGTDKLLIINDEVWLPLSFSYFNNGFFDSWTAAADQLTRAFSNGEWVDIIILENAWPSYPPVNLPPQQVRFTPPVETATIREAEAVLGRYISAEILPKIEALNASLRSGATGALYNQLGLLYTRAGMQREARTAYQQGADMNYVSSMLNLGNMAILDNDTALAERWFRQALSLAPDNAAAKRMLDQMAAD
ncbi:tetratricopeptide repeat protein [Treponema primitia]|nr:hypothetical protein [Treponema primitia]